MNIDLKNKAILLTGATGGIGMAIARFLGKCGAAVALHYFRNKAAAEQLAAEIGNGSKIFPCDLSSPLDSAALFKKVVQTMGHVDVLVNNAGIYHYSPVTAPVEQWTADWEKTIQINLTSVGILCREAITHFMSRGGGRIINIASRAAFRGDDADHFAYAASKGGVVSLSRTIARTFGRKNITCFVIAPGFVRTPMTDEYFAEHGDQGVLDELALARMTEPVDIAPLVAFIAAGLMDHATGSTIDINAGSYMR